jgi:hypothetical protein
VRTFAALVGHEKGFEVDGKPFDEAGAKEEAF